MNKQQKVLVLAMALTLPAASLLSPVAHAHGYISHPLTRNMMCKQQGGFWSGTPPTAGCQAYKNSGQWNAPFTDEGGSVGSGWLNYQQTIPDGKICSVNYPALNTLVTRGDWPTTRLHPGADGTIDLRYKYTAYHGTDHIAFYITKTPYDPSQPLKWNDLELLGKRDGANQPDSNREAHFRYALPSHQSGRHVIVAAWPVSAQHGTSEVFVSCADVDIENNGVAAPAWETIGEGLRRDDSVAKGTTINFRLFDASRSGSVAFATTLTAESEMAAHTWLHQLAQKINSETSLIKVGHLDGDDVSAEQPANYYNVYSQGARHYRYAISLKQPDAEQPEQPAAADVNAGPDLNVTTPTGSSQAWALQGSGKNAAAYEWSIVSGAGTFWLQEAHAAGWVRKVKGLNARALVPQGVSGTAVYRLSALDASGKVIATDDVTLTATEAKAPVAVISSAQDFTQGVHYLSLGANRSYFPDGRPIQQARFAWSLSGDHADKVMMNGESGVSTMVRAKSAPTTAFTATVNLRVTDEKTGEFTTIAKEIRFLPN